MPTYTFRCEDHGDWDIFLPFAQFDDPQACEVCATRLVRVLATPQIIKSSLRHEAHFDHSLGGVVTDQHSREELAKRKGEAEGRSIVFADPTDHKALGVSDEGLDATRRQKRDTGEVEGTTKYL